MNFDCTKKGRLRGQRCGAVLFDPAPALQFVAVKKLRKISLFICRGFFHSQKGTGALLWSSSTSLQGCVAMPVEMEFFCRIFIVAKDVGRR